MLFRESIAIALTALFSNKLRSILTMLGIIIGVGAVIVMISIGMGVKKEVTDSIASLGSNMLIVTPVHRIPAVSAQLPARVKS